MLTIISPAKSMDFSQEFEKVKSTAPLYQNEANLLAKEMSSYSIEELAKLLKISPKLAESTYYRYKEFNDEQYYKLPAIIAYRGTVFKEFRASEMNVPELEFTQNNLRIISVLYGVLRPLDAIKPYRLEYGTKIENVGNLHQFWHNKLSNKLIEDINECGGTLINLGSLDLLPALDMELINKSVTVITPEFKTLKNGKLQNILSYTKKARGAMVNYIIKNQITEPERLKEFSFMKYKYSEKLSTENNYIYCDIG